MNIEYRDGYSTEWIDQILAVHNKTDMKRIEQHKEMISLAFAASYAIATSWVGPRLIACGRMISDGQMYSGVFDVVVDPEFQGQGVGREIMSRLIAKAPQTCIHLDLTYLKNLIDQADLNNFKPDSLQSKVLSQLKNGDVFNEFTVLLNNIINLSTYKVPFRDGSQEGHVHWYEENYGGENRIAFSISHSDKLKAVFSKESGNKTSKDPSPIVDFDDLSSDILSRGDFLFVEGLIYKAKSYPDFGQEPIPVKGVIKFNRSSNNMLIKFDFPHAFDLLTTNGNVIEFNTNFYSFYSQNEHGDFVSTLKASYLSENAKRVMKRYFTLVEAVKDAKDLNLELDKEIKNSILNKIIQFKMEIDSLQQQSNPSPPKGFSLKGIVNFFGRNLPK